MKEEIQRRDRIVSSAVWSAYGDALGFMSELTDRSGLQHRTEFDRIETTVNWKRRIGGRFGIIVDLPAGIYSDDTQLRLATSRAIRGDGTFDAHAFSKVEIPVWNSYALGAGRGTRAAAVNMSKEGVAWFSNFFKTKDADYLNSGGNGAAMRIQPHVWVATESQVFSDLMMPIFQNAIITHGHPRGFVGALVHALCVFCAVRTGACPSLNDICDAIRVIEELPNLVPNDPDISMFWLPTWEDRAGVTLRKAVDEVLDEVRAKLTMIKSLQGTSAEKYSEAVTLLDATNESKKGSGVITTVLAAFLAHEFESQGINPALLLAANALGTDTDSIATMVGAILGAVDTRENHAVLLDRSYIEMEAHRLAEIGAGKRQEQFIYPDLFKWSPPKTQMDSVSEENGKTYVLGLGEVLERSMQMFSNNRSSESWQFLETLFGQTLLIKRRAFEGRTPRKGNPPTNKFGMKKNLSSTGKESELTLSGFELTPAPRSIDELTSEAISNAFDPSILGHHLLELSEGANGVEKAIAYASIIAKAKISRNKKK